MYNSIAIFTSKCSSGVGKSQELVKNILLYNNSFTIQDGSQLWPIGSVNTTFMLKSTNDSGYNIVCVTLIPFWNNFHWFEHAKTNIFKVLYNKLSMHDGIDLILLGLFLRGFLTKYWHKYSQPHKSGIKWKLGISTFYLCHFLRNIVSSMIKIIDKIHISLVQICIGVG